MSPNALQHQHTIRVLWVVVAAISLAAAVSGWVRGLHERPDWRDFRNESTYVWLHGCSAPGTAMFGYLPAMPVLLWPLTAWTPNELGITAFVLSSAACAAGAALALKRLWATSAHPSIALPLALLLCCPYLALALQSNQFTLWTLVLIVAGIGLVERNRSIVGGAALGVAVIIKTIPILLAGYLLIRRKWTALLSLFATVIVLEGGTCLLAFGPSGAVREHLEWVRRVAWHSNRVQIQDPLLRVHRHGSNQSFSSVLARWLRGRPQGSVQVIVKGEAPAAVVEEVRRTLAPYELLSIDPMPPREQPWEILRKDISHVPTWHAASWTPGTVYGTWAMILVLAFAGLIYLTCKMSARAPEAWQPIAALWILGLFWPSPMMRDYYLVWALPAAWALLAGNGRDEPHPQHRPLRLTPILACGIAWLAGAIALAIDWAMWYGVHLFLLALLAGAIALKPIHSLLAQPARAIPHP